MPQKVHCKKRVGQRLNTANLLLCLKFTALCSDGHVKLLLDRQRVAWSTHLGRQQSGPADK